MRKTWCVLRLAIALLCALAAMPTAFAESLYKSIGPDGRVVYSDRPPATGRIDKILRFKDLPSSALPVSAAANLDKMRGAGSASNDAAMGGVVLFSARWCGYCKKAKSYMNGKGIAYQEIDIDTPPGMAAFARAGGGRGVPLLIAGEQRVQGFSRGAYDAVFSGER